MSMQSQSYESLAANRGGRGVTSSSPTRAQAQAHAISFSQSQSQLQPQGRLRSMTPTPTSTSRSPREYQLEERNEYLERELRKVEDLLAEARVDRDQLIGRVQNISEKFELDMRRGSSPSRLQAQTPQSQSLMSRDSAELRRRYDEERNEQQHQQQQQQRLFKLDQAQAAQNRQLEMMESLQADVGRFQRKCDDAEVRLAAAEAESPDDHPPQLDTSSLRRSAAVVSASDSKLPAAVSSASLVMARNSSWERERDREERMTEQLEQATRSNTRLQTEVERLRGELAAARAALDRRDAEAAERERQLSDASTDSHVRLTEAWRSVVAFRKNLHELRVQVERQLSAPRSELANLRERLLAALAAFASNARANEQRMQAAHERELRELRDSLERQYREARETLERQLREMQAATERQLAEARSAREAASARDANIGQPDALRTLAVEAESLQRALRELAQTVLSATANEQATIGSLADSAEDQLALALVDIGIPPNSALTPAPTPNPAASTEIAPLAGSTRGVFVDNALNVVRQALQRRQTRLAGAARAAQANRAALLQARSQLEESEAERRVIEVRSLQLQSELDVARRESGDIRAECDKLRKQVAEARAEREKADADRVASLRSRDQLERRVKDSEVRCKELKEAFDRTEDELNRRRAEGESHLRSLETRTKQLAEAEERLSRLKEELVSTREVLRRFELDRELLDTRHLALEESLATAERTRADSESAIGRLRSELERTIDAAQKLAAANQHLEADKEALKNALVQLEAASTRLAEDKRRVDTELTVAREEGVRAEQQRVTLESDKQRLSAELHSARNEVSTLDETLRRTNREKADLVDKLAAAARQKAVASDELSRLRSEVERMQSALSSLLEEKSATVDQLDRAHTALRELETQLLRSEQQNNLLRDEKRLVESTLAEAHDLVEQLEAKRAKLEAQLTEANEKRTALERQHANDVSELEKLRLDSVSIIREREQQLLAESARQIDHLKNHFDEETRRAAEVHDAEIGQLRGHIVELERLMEEWRARCDSLTADTEQNLQEAKARHDAERAELVRELLRIAQTRDEQLLAIENEKEQLRSAAEREKLSLVEKLRVAEKERGTLSAELDRCRAESATRDAAEKQRHSDMKSELERLQSHLDAACAERERHAEVISSEMAALQRDFDSARLEIEALEQRVRNAEQQRDAAKRDLAESSRERLANADALTAIEREFNEMRVSLTEVTREKDMLARSADELRERVRSCEARRNEASRGQQEALGRLSLAEQRAIALADELGATRDAARAEEQRAAQSANEAADLRRSLKICETDVARVSSELEDARSQIAQRDRLVEDLRKELVAFRQRLADSENRAEAFRVELHNARAAGDDREAALSARVTELGCELEQALAAQRVAEESKLATVNRLHEFEERAQAVMAELAKVETEKQALDAALTRADRERRDLEFKLAAVAASARRLFKYDELPERDRDRGFESDRADVEPEEIRTGLRHAAQVLNALERERAALAEAHAQAQTRLAERSRDLEVISARAQQAEKRLAELTELRRDDEARLVAARNETLVEREKVSRVEHEMAAVRDRLNSLEAANRQISEQKVAIANRLEEAERANLELRAFAEELEQQVRFIEQLRLNLDNDLQRCQLVIRERDNEIRVLRSRHDRYDSLSSSYPMSDTNGESVDKQTTGMVVDRLAAQLREREAALNQANETTQQLSLQLARSNAIVHELESRLGHAPPASDLGSADLRSQLADARNELRSLADRLTESERERATLQAAVAEQRSAKDTEWLARVHAAESERQAAVIKCESLEKRATVAELQRQRIEFERNTLAQKLEHAEEQRERLKAQIASRNQSPQDAAFDDRARELFGAMRKLEDENAALVRRTRQLETNLREAEQKCARRVVQLEEPTSSPVPNEGDAREFAYRMRIRGLERQVGVLKEQLADELVKRSRAGSPLEEEARKREAEAMFQRRDLPPTAPGSQTRLASAAARFGGSQSNLSLAARYLANARGRSRSPPRDDLDAKLRSAADVRPMSIMSNDDSSNRSTTF